MQRSTHAAVRSAVVVHPLLTPRKLARHAFVLLVVAGCVVAGIWQIHRLGDRRAYNAEAERRLHMDPQPLAAVLPPGASVDPDDVAWRRVTVEGVFDEANEFVVLGGELDGQPGNHVLTPLVAAGGSAVMVDRGWVPFALASPPVRQAAPPAGTVEVTGVVFPSQVEDGTSRAANVITRIDLGAIDRRLPYSVARVYVWLQAQQPASGALPRRVPLPELTNGPHLSYAIQWFSFALIGLVGYPVVLRRELRRTRDRTAVRSA